MVRKKLGPGVNLDCELDYANLIFTQRFRPRLAGGKHTVISWVLAL